MKFLFVFNKYFIFPYSIYSVLSESVPVGTLLNVVAIRHGTPEDDLEREQTDGTVQVNGLFILGELLEYILYINLHKVTEQVKTFYYIQNIV